MLPTADPASILIVEDEDAIRGVLTFTLARTGHLIDEANDCANARHKLQTGLPDLVILDWMLPDASGLELLREMRRNPRTRELPVLMLTARCDEADKITALRSGADDYVTKPFSREELLLRVDAILRRCRQVSETHRLEFGPLSLDSVSHRVTLNGHELNFSRMEFRLLRCLMLSPDRVFSRAQLLEKVWQSSGYIDERTIDVHIMRIRTALGRDSYGHCVETVRGLGYRFAPNAMQSVATIRPH
ncbi:MAG: response regulator [Pseudomonadota bacterium]